MNPWASKRAAQKSRRALTSQDLAQVDAVIGDRGPYVLIVGKEHMHTDCSDPLAALGLVTAAAVALLGAAESPAERARMVKRMQKAISAALAKEGE